MKSVADILSNEEIDQVHANANFGTMSNRAVVDEGVTKYFCGYTSGYNQFLILCEHGLLKRHKDVHSLKGSLTKKGMDYLRALMRQTTRS
jgi:hypothetical protein